MKHRISMAIVCLHISALLYFMVGVLTLLLFGFGVWPPDPEPGPREVPPFVERLVGGLCILVLCLALIAGIEVVVYGLHQRKFWAWIAGLCIFGMYAPSLFFPLGALGLWGLLDSGSRAEFGLNGASRGYRDRPPL
jgi:fumarate reductase subunit D